MSKTPENSKKNKSTTTLSWRDDVPVADAYDDVYYSKENGLEETKFVFLKGNNLPDDWTNKDTFTIAETGFGTGLNFLATWQAWRETNAQRVLTFISVEKHLLDEASLSRALGNFPELNTLSEQLIAAWPPNAAGFHFRSFDSGRVRLILMIGDAAHMYSQQRAKVDAWYLDGFAPSKNPDMWADNVMDQIARLSKCGTTFATFTAAGFVRRALMARGFNVEKSAGYGRKRERLIGRFENSDIAFTGFNGPDWAEPDFNRKDGSIAIIGGGIAGASLVEKLKNYGREVTLVTSPDIDAASNLPAAIITPRFMLEENIQSTFFASAFAHSVTHPVLNGCFEGPAGVIIKPKNAKDADRLKQISINNTWGDSWLTGSETIDNTDIKLPRSAALNARKAISMLTQNAPIIEKQITEIKRENDIWHLLDVDHAIAHSCDILIIAAGPYSNSLLQDADIELRPNHGQIECCAVSDSSPLPNQNIAFGGYLTAAVENDDKSKIQTIGSTFNRLQSIDDATDKPTDQDRDRILASFKNITGIHVTANDIAFSWQNIRATTPDHMPYAGPVASSDSLNQQFALLAKDANTQNLGSPNYTEGLYVLTGLGSKGFQYGPLCAEYVAAQICGLPSPLSSLLDASLSPQRTTIKQIIRKNANS